MYISTLNELYVVHRGEYRKLCVEMNKIQLIYTYIQYGVYINYLVIKNYIWSRGWILNHIFTRVAMSWPIWNYFGWIYILSCDVIKSYHSLITHVQNLASAALRPRVASRGLAASIKRAVWQQFLAVDIWKSSKMVCEQKY